MMTEKLKNVQAALTTKEVFDKRSNFEFDQMKDLRFGFESTTPIEERNQTTFILFFSFFFFFMSGHSISYVLSA
jgi:hypothetical protein